MFQIPALQAQELKDESKRLEKLFEDKVTNIHQEKIYVQTDRHLYITGETIWLSVYCVDASFHTLSNSSKVVNIELIDANGNAVVQKRIHLIDGVGSGQLFLSAELATGQYGLRAFTNWMKNFDPTFAYYRNLLVVNPIVEPNERSVQMADRSENIRFFPEGGSIINDLKSNIAVRAIDDSGKGMQLSGVVYDNEGNEITTLQTSNLGYGNFEITPQKGRSYYAHILESDTLRKIPLPRAKTDGFVMAVKQESGNYSIYLKTNSKEYQNVYMVVQTRGVLKKLEQVNLKNGESVVQLQKDSLASGVSQISILDSSFKLIAKRLVFKYPDEEKRINVSLEKQFGQREKVVLDVRNNLLTDDSVARFSISVSKTNDSEQPYDNIVTNLLLTSDLGTTTLIPSHFFDEKNGNKESQIDLFMCTNGWNRFHWSEVTRNERMKFKHLPEINAPLVSGEVHANAKGILPTYLHMGFWGEDAYINSTKIDSTGRFYFELPFQFKKEKAYFFTNDSLYENQLSIDSPFNFPLSHSLNGTLKLDSRSKDYIEKLSVNTQISQIYKTHSHINGIAENDTSVTDPFYGKPDNMYLLDDYTRFETVQDLFIEYIRLAYIRKQNKEIKFDVYSETPLSKPPLVMIDGVPIKDPEFVLGFDPLKIEKMDIINQMYYLGATEYGGIINFITYKHDFDLQELPDYLVQKTYHAVQTPRAFYSPNYSQNANSLERIPDYRNTLYWDPDVRISYGETINLEFYTSDDTGNYKIEINGITSSGYPFYVEDFFKVVKTSANP